MELNGRDDGAAKPNTWDWSKLTLPPKCASPEPEPTAKPILPECTPPEPESTTKPLSPKCTSPEPESTTKPKSPKCTSPEPESTTNPQIPGQSQMHQDNLDDDIYSSECTQVDASSHLHDKTQIADQSHMNQDKSDGDASMSCTQLDASNHPQDKSQIPCQSKVHQDKLDDDTSMSDCPQLDASTHSHENPQIPSQSQMHQDQLDCDTSMSDCTQLQSSGFPQTDASVRPQLDASSLPQLDASIYPQLDASGYPQLDAFGYPQLDAPSYPQPEGYMFSNYTEHRFISAQSSCPQGAPALQDLEWVEPVSSVQSPEAFLEDITRPHNSKKRVAQGRPRIPDSQLKRPRLVDPRSKPTKLQSNNPLMIGVPTDIWVNIFHFTDYKTLLDLRLTCKEFSETITGEGYWKNYIEGHLPLPGLELESPSLPPDMSYMHFTHLLLGQGCMDCKAPKTAKVQWAFYRRWCKTCFWKHTITVRRQSSFLVKVNFANLFMDRALRLKASPSSTVLSSTAFLLRNSICGRSTTMSLSLLKRCRAYQSDRMQH